MYEVVTTCPFAGKRGEAHGCAFRRRKDARSRHQHLFVKNVGKNRRKLVKMKILSSGVVFTFEEGISTSHVCLKGQQPHFLELWKLCYLYFYFFLFFEVNKSGALAPTYPPSKRKSDLRSSSLKVDQAILLLES